MKRPIDDGDVAYERAKDDAMDAAWKARIDSLTREQIEALYELAEADYDHELVWRATVANEKLIDGTTDAACWSAARVEKKRLEGVRSNTYARMDRARTEWAARRPKP